MKFEHTLKSRATLKKQKIFEFKELKQEDLDKGLISTFEKPYYICRDGCLFELYKDRGKLAVIMHHSWDKFMEIKENGN